MHHCISLHIIAYHHIISNQNRDKGRPICIIAYEIFDQKNYIIWKQNRDKGGPYVSLHNDNKMTRYICNTLCSVYLSIIPKSITGGHVGTIAAILDFLKWSYLSIKMSFIIDL